MSSTFTNREQIAGQIGKNLGLTKTKVRKIILSFEDQIAADLKKKSKVKLSNFGTLYLLERKSRTIKQVKTGSKRLLLERTVIKFKSALTLKARLVGKVLKPRIVKKVSPDVAVKEAPEQVKVIEKPKTSEEIKVKKPIRRLSFPPLKMMPAVDREKIKQQIKERLSRLKILQREKSEDINLPTSMDLRKSRSGLVFDNLLREIFSKNAKQFDFSITSSENVNVFMGRPRRKVARLPKKIVEEFLDRYCEIDDYNSFQQRFVKIKQSSKIGIRTMLDLHLFPTHNGASIHIKIQ